MEALEQAADGACAAGEGDKAQTLYRQLRYKVLAVGMDRKRPGTSLPTKQLLDQAFPEPWARKA